MKNLKIIGHLSLLILMVSCSRNEHVKKINERDYSKIEENKPEEIAEKPQNGDEIIFDHENLDIRSVWRIPSYDYIKWSKYIKLSGIWLVKLTVLKYINLANLIDRPLNKQQAW